MNNEIKKENKGFSKHGIIGITIFFIVIFIAVTIIIAMSINNNNSQKEFDKKIEITNKNSVELTEFTTEEENENLDFSINKTISYQSSVCGIGNINFEIYIGNQKLYIKNLNTNEIKQINIFKPKTIISYNSAAGFPCDQAEYIILTEEGILYRVSNQINYMEDFNNISQYISLLDANKKFDAITQKIKNYKDNNGNDIGGTNILIGKTLDGSIYQVKFEQNYDNDENSNKLVGKIFQNSIGVGSYFTELYYFTNDEFYYSNIEGPIKENQILHMVGTWNFVDGTLTLNVKKKITATGGEIYNDAILGNTLVNYIETENSNEFVLSYKIYEKELDGLKYFDGDLILYRVNLSDEDISRLFF